jgi:tRNA A-37 threonylcarbamoyl transferase component Bud32
MATGVIPDRVSDLFGAGGPTIEGLEPPKGVSRDNVEGIESVGHSRTNETYRVYVDGSDDYVLKVFDEPWTEKLFYDMGQWMAELRSEGGHLYDRVRSEIELNEVLEESGVRVADIDLVDVPLDDLGDLGRDEWWSDLTEEFEESGSVESSASVEWTPPGLERSLEVRPTESDEVEVWMDYLEGEQAKEAIMNSPEDANWFGEELGDVLDYVHERDYRIFDLRLKNFLIEENDGGGYKNLGLVDQEFAFQDESKPTREVDIGNLLSSAMQLDYDSFESFYEGFEDSYSSEIDQDVVGFARIVSTLHAAEEGDFKRAYRAWNNGKRFIYQNYEDSVDEVMLSSIETARNRISESNDSYSQEMEGLMTEIRENPSEYLKERFGKKLISLGLKAGELGYEAS